jgi:hypothetical protein
MTCPATEKWLLLSLGELTVNESTELERHRDRCPRCREQARASDQMLSDLASPTSGEAPVERFVSEVLARCARGESTPQVRSSGGVYKLIVSGAIASAAAAALLLVVRPAPEVQERWTARGASRSAQQGLPRAGLFIVRDGKARPAQGATLRPGDGFLVRCENPGAVTTYLAVFARDARGETHWLYPAYLDARDNPRSVAVAAHTPERSLEDVVEPEAPAPGPMRVYALFTAEPLGVHELEAQLGTEQHTQLTELNPTRIQEWSVSWNE